MTYEEMKAMQDKKPRKKPRHEEEDMQMRCVKWFDLQHKDKRLHLHHSPNGGRRNPREAARFKAMGTRAGFPDLILLYPNKFYPYMVIEMKSEKGRIEDTQKAYRSMFESLGVKYVIVRSFDEFKKEITEYLKDN